MIILPIISILTYTLLTAYITGVSITKSLIPTFCTLMIFLYLACMAGFIKFAGYFIYTGSVIILPALLYKNKTYLLKKLLLYKQNVVLLTVTLIIFAIYTSNADFHSWDEFSFWGIASKELLLYHFFENQFLPTGILEVHAHYPRGSAVFHYFMMLLPGFSEGSALFSHFLLHLILISPLLANRKWYQSLFLISVLFAVVVLYTTGIRAIYNDSIIGLMFASTIAIYLLSDNKEKAIYLIFPIICFMPLVREIGLVLSFIASGIVICDSFSPFKPKKLLLYLLMLTTPYLLHLAWLNYFIGTHDFFGRKPHSINNILEIINNFDQYSSKVIFLYLKAFLKFLFKEGSIAVFIILMLSRYSAKHHSPYQYNRWKSLLYQLLVGLVVFTLWRLYLYMVIFSSEEALRSASLLRYLGTYCIVFAVTACCFIKECLFKASIKQKDFIIIIALTLISCITTINNIRRISHTNNPSIALYNRQVYAVYNMIIDHHEIEYNYTNKQNNLDCYKLNYKLSPLYPKNEFQKCLAAPEVSILKDKQLNYIKNTISLEHNKYVFYPFLLTK